MFESSLPLPPPPYVMAIVDGIYLAHHTAQGLAYVKTMPLEDCARMVSNAYEAEGEQRAEYAMGAASMGYNPSEWAPAYDGYRVADDPIVAACEARLRAESPVRREPPIWSPLVPRDYDDIPF